MNIHHASIWEDAALHEQPAGRRTHARVPGSAKYILYSIIGIVVSIIIPALLMLGGVGMSQQDASVALDSALASLIAIVFSFLIIRRLLRFPLLQHNYGYIALTFAINFFIIAVLLKFLRINFSSPQFFLGMAMITVMVELFFYARRRWAPARLAVVPGEASVAKLPGEVGSVQFTMLSSVPEVGFNYNGVVADLSSDLEAQWERFIALSALRGVP